MFPRKKMNLLIVALVLSSQLSHVRSLEEEKVEVKIEENGKQKTVIGKLQMNWNQEKFYSFQGIPYAQAPIKQLRFKDPQALPELPAITEALYEGHDCPSIYAQNASEDCLNLNVYSQQLKPEKLLPVLAFIHPGGFYIGSGLSSFIGPEYLLTKPLVLVTFNYRLGSLGFLNLGSEEVPGNAGLKDQVLALRWLQKYIKHFGGNPEDVTLMGYSAGGLSVGLHLVSPMSKNLFQKAIIMSGNMPPQTILPKGQQKYLALRQIEQLNCTANPAQVDRDILQCLNRFEGSQIAATLRQLFDFGKDNPIYLWLPVIENDFGQERFLTKDFFESLKLGEYEKVPILTGFVDGEFCTSAKEIIESEKLEKEFYHHMETLAPLMFMYKGQNNSDKITQALRNKYLPTSNIKATDFTRFCDLYSDSLIRFGGDRIASLVSSTNEVYSYKFTYKGKVSNLNYPQVPIQRVEHIDDLMYLFKMPYYDIPRISEDYKISELYVNFIYDFMLNGKFSSNPEAKYPNKFALIDKTLTYENGLSFPERDFWNQLFPLN